MAYKPRSVIIDFESFYDTKAKYSLKDMSYPEFVLDKRFKVFGMSVNDGKASTWVPANQVPNALAMYQQDILVAHNTFFDAAVLTWRYKFRPAYMIDTLQLANHVFGSSRDINVGGAEGGNDLANLALRLGLKPKAKNVLVSMNGVHDPDEATLAALAVYSKDDATLARQILNKLLPQMTNADFELWLLDHTIRLYTERPLDIDLAKLEATVKKVDVRRQQAIADSGVTKAVLNSNKQFAAELTSRLKASKIKLPTKRPAKPRKDGVTLIPALAKGDVAFQKLAETVDAKGAPSSVARLVQARIIERSAVTVAARLATMKKYVDMGIGIPVHLVYYGAHTGRFSGGGGFNFQNLTSPGRAATQFDREVAGMVRECIVAGIDPITGEKRVFVPTDAAQIEARVLAWLAGEQSILGAYATGADLYSDFIGEVLKEEVHKPGEKDKADMAKYIRLGILRQVGKESILGLGYSMGDEKFYSNVKAGGSVKSKELVKFVEDGGFGKEIRKSNGGKTTQMAADIVAFYREKYPNIVQFWSDLDKAFRAAITGAIRKVGPLTFERVGPKAVGIVLPSGRTLYYRHLRQEVEIRANDKRSLVWKHGKGQKVYGGLLAENVTQAVARDILAESIHAAEEAGYPVVLHIHDEIVPRVPESQGKAALEFLIKSLSTPPSWGEGMVLGAEGGITTTLSK